MTELGTKGMGAGGGERVDGRAHGAATTPGRCSSPTAPAVLSELVGPARSDEDVKVTRVWFIVAVAVGALAGAIVGIVPVFVLGLSFSELIVLPLSLGVAGLFAAVSAAWIGTLFSPDRSATRLLPTVAVTDLAAGGRGPAGRGRPGGRRPGRRTRRAHRRRAGQGVAAAGLRRSSRRSCPWRAGPIGTWTGPGRPTGAV